jgi:hypothetical protein
MTQGKKVTLTEFMALVKEVDEKGRGLNPWEIEFIASFIDNPPKTFTEAQLKKVRQIKGYRVR